MRAPITDKHLLELMWERFPEIMKRGAEQPPQQEPVAYVCTNSKGWPTYGEKPHDYFGGKPLYSKPAQRTWVGLTDVEWMNIVNKDQAWFGQRPDEVAHEVAKLVEAKLKEKNTCLN